MHNQGKYDSDNQLFRMFCSRGKEAVNKIYHDFYILIKFMVVKNSGVAQDAEDVFQEGLLVLLSYCGKTTFSLNAPFKNFFYTVCKNIWLKKLRKNRRLEITFVDVWESVDLKGAVKAEEAAGLTIERLVLLWKYMNRLPEHEQKTLRLFYLEEKSLKEIAEIMGFSDEVSARVQKFKYVRHLRKLIREDPDYE